MDNENPTLIARLWQKFNNYEALLKKVSDRFLETWIVLGIIALGIFCGSAFVGMFVEAIPYFLALMALSLYTYWCWKLVIKRKALVLYVYLSLAILEYFLFVVFFYRMAQDFPGPSGPDWVIYLIPGVVLASPAITLYWLKRKRIIQ